MPLAPELIERFRTDLDALVAPDARLGLAVSGGPDSMALLLLAAEARPGAVEAATVDHGLRPDSREEAQFVAGACERLGVPHEILEAKWKAKPTTGLQARARAERYRLLGGWASDRGLGAIATAHHLDDQAETVLMRLFRGSGVRGLAGMRRASRSAGIDLLLVRPLLGWRRSELEQVCADAGIAPVEDPSNADEQFERVRVRRALAEADWLDPAAVVRSAAHLGAADSALDWAATQVWEHLVSARPAEILFDPAGVPAEIRRRIVGRAVLRLGSEGKGADLRGRELDRLLAVLASGRRATLRGVLCVGGRSWRFVPAPKRTRPVDKLR